MRDGKSFATRRVEAIQRGTVIFTLFASFQVMLLFVFLVVIITRGIETASLGFSNSEHESLDYIPRRYHQNNFSLVYPLLINKSLSIES